ncbi:MAG: hypothetical protein VX704_08530 [Verrucomicrobiota bacterium]|nr:hypothetical protein [Verrucomicrobiota bacterium]
MAQGSSKNRIKNKVKAKGRAPEVTPRLNLSPTQEAVVVVYESNGIRLEAMRWGGG